MLHSFPVPLVMGGIIGMLVTLLLRPLRNDIPGILRLLADIAHLLAFPLGLLAAIFDRHRAAG